MFDYSGSTALVTGASKGLGEAFAEALAARGMNLVLVARSTKKLNDLSARLNAKYKIQCTVLSVDLADPNSPRALADELERRGIQVDLLVNNAGFGLSGAFLSHDRKQKQAEIEVNVQALVALTHHFGEAMWPRTPAFNLCPIWRPMLRPKLSSSTSARPSATNSLEAAFR